MKPNIIHHDEEFIAWELVFYEPSQFAYPSDHTHNLNGKTMAHGLMCTCPHHASTKLYNWSIVFSSSTSVVIIKHIHGRFKERWMAADNQLIPDLISLKT